jgi:hypothetical protein
MASDLVWPVDMAADTNSFTPPTQVTPVPEPATYVLMLLGLMAIAFVMRRRAH